MKTHPMSLFDYSFFLMESKENPKHVAKLMIFRKPQGAKKTFLKDLQQHWLRAETVVPVIPGRDSTAEHAPAKSPEDGSRYVVGNVLTYLASRRDCRAVGHQSGENCGQ